MFYLKGTHLYPAPSEQAWLQQSSSAEQSLLIGRQWGGVGIGGDGNGDDGDAVGVVGSVEDSDSVEERLLYSDHERGRGRV